MILYKSKLTERIFDNLRKQGGECITTLNGATVDSLQFSSSILHQAKCFSKYGMVGGDRIAILLRDTILFSKCIISTLVCGGSVVLLDPEMGREMMQEKIQSTGIKFILIEGMLYDYYRASGFDIGSLGGEVIIVGRSLFAWKKQKLSSMLSQEYREEITYIPLNDTHESMIVFTGGTTGNPRGVIHTVSSLLVTAKKIEGLLYNPTIFYADMPHFLLLALLMGVRIVAGNPNISPKKFLKILSKHHIDTYFSPPYKYTYAIENHKQLPKSLKNIILGSAPVYEGFLRQLFTIAQDVPHIICTYGMTEILPIASIDAREKVLEYSSGDILGYILPGVNYKIKNGELWIEKDLSTGYYLDDTSGKYIETGDMVSLDEDLLVMQGRKKDMIIRKDYNIYPSLYESLITRIPGILDAALVGIYDEKNSDETVVLFLETSEKSYTKNQILGLLRTGAFSIDAYAIPDEILFMPLPRKGRQNKIDKIALRNFAVSKFL